MTNLEILSIVTAYQNGTSLKLPAAVAWKRRVNLDKLFRAKKLIDEALQEAREPFLDDLHSTEAENGTRQILPKYIDAFVESQNEILTQDTDIDIKKVKIEDIGDIEISDSDMDTLAFMIEE